MQNTTDHLYQACDPHNHKWIQDELNPGRLMDEYARLTLVREAMYGRGTSLAAIKAFGLTTLPYMLPTAARRMMALACNEKNELARIRQAHQQDNIRLVIAYNNIDHNNAYRDLSSSVFEHTDMYTVYVSVRDPFDPPLIADYFVDNYGIGVKKLVIDTHGDRGSFDAGWYKNFRAQIGEVSRAVDEKSAIELDMAEDKAIISPQHFLGWLAVHGIVSSESLLVLASCYGDTIAPEVAEAAQLTVLAAVEKTGLTYDQAKGGTAFLTPSVALRPDGSQIAELPVSP